MSISSRSWVRELCFILSPAGGYDYYTMNANSFIRSALVRGWFVTRREARLIRDDAQIHNIIYMGCHYTI